jgi:hypothetical protein
VFFSSHGHSGLYAIFCCIVSKPSLQFSNLNGGNKNNSSGGLRSTDLSTHSTRCMEAGDLVTMTKHRVPLGWEDKMQLITSLTIPGMWREFTSRNVTHEWKWLGPLQPSQAFRYPRISTRVNLEPASVTTVSGNLNVTRGPEVGVHNPTNLTDFDFGLIPNYEIIFINILQDTLSVFSHRTSQFYM